MASPQEKGNADGYQPNVSDVNILDLEIGFSRKEMYKSKLVGTVKEYDTHMFVCVDSKAESWPKGKVEDISEKLNEEIKSRKSDISRMIKITVAEASGFEESKHGDVLLFPDMKRFSGITENDVPKFVEEILIGTSNSSFSEHELNGIHIFVCCHSQWDARCGACGPPLVEGFRVLAKENGMEKKVAVWPCSHIGGHKFAGNVILYNARPDGTVTGDWYGYVTPKDMPTLFDAALEGKIIDSLWRGGMGLSKEAQETEQALRFEGCGANCACINETVSTEEMSTNLEKDVKNKDQEIKNAPGVKFSHLSLGNNKTATLIAATVAVGAIAAFWYIRTHRSIP